MSVATGSHTVLVYRWEDDNEFNQDPSSLSDTTDKIFGANESLSSADRSNNPERMFRPFDRGSERIIEQQFDGSWGADFTLTNTWWLQFIYGAPSTSGTAPATHTYEFAARDPPKSAQIIEETHYPDGTISQTVYKGCVVSSATIDVSTEDTAEISLDGAYADEEFYENAEEGSPFGLIGAQPATEYRPLHFGNSTLRMDMSGDGSVDTKALVQDASLDLEGNVEMARELGTRFAAAVQYLQFEPSLSYTQLVGLDVKSEEQQAAYGSATSTSPEETMSAADDFDGELQFNAATGTNNDIVFNLHGAFPEDFSRNNIGDPQEALEDDVDRMIADVSVSVTSDQASPP